MSRAVCAQTSGDVFRDSFNHYSLGAVCQFLFEYVAGIRPVKPGFKEFELSPVTGGSLTLLGCRHLMSADITFAVPVGIRMVLLAVGLTAGTFVPMELGIEFYCTVKIMAVCDRGLQREIADRTELRRLLCCGRTRSMNGMVGALTANGTDLPVTVGIGMPCGCGRVTERLTFDCIAAVALTGLCFGACRVGKVMTERCNTDRRNVFDHIGRFCIVKQFGTAGTTVVFNAAVCHAGGL